MTLLDPLIVVQAIGDDDGLRALEPEWWALYEQSPGATPFEAPGWLLAARRHLPDGARPYALAARRGRQLVGLLPLENAAGVLRFVGTGVTDYHDLLAAPGLEQAVAAASLAHLASSTVWKSITLDGLAATSPLTQRPLPAGWDGALSAGEPSPVVSLPVRRMPQKIAYDRRRLERTGRVRWRTAADTHPRALLDALFALHEARWKSVGQSGVLADPAVQRFHCQAAPALARHGLLRMHALELDGQIVGVLYGFARARRYHFYLSGFEPERAKLSPGALLIAQAIEQAASESMIEFDFLRGQEAYKYTWGAVDRPSFVRHIRRS